MKTIQRKTSSYANANTSAPRKEAGGPKTSRVSSELPAQLHGDDCVEAISLLKHTTDREMVLAKMRETFAYRQIVIHDQQQTSDILSVFPRFLDTKGLVSIIYNCLTKGDH